MYRLCHFAPGDAFFQSLREQIEKRRALSSRQIEAVQRNYRERGELDGMRKRKHTVWRLQRLDDIDLEKDDQATVSRFLSFARSRTGLRESKLPVIGALEARYEAQRLETTIAHAQQIVALLQEPLPVG